MYLCTVTIILVAIIKMEITYINGFISEACLRGLKDFEQVRDAIIVVKCEGYHSEEVQWIWQEMLLFISSKFCVLKQDYSLSLLRASAEWIPKGITRQK